MDYLFLQEFLASYSLPTLAIAIFACVVRLTLEKFFKNLPKLFMSYLPFILAVILYFAYDMIFITMQFKFTKTTFYAGILSGSLSVIIYSSINKITKGKPIVANATILLIEGILNEYVAQDILTKTAIEIEKVLSIDDDTIMDQQVVDTLTYNCPELSDSVVYHLAKLIIAGAKNIQET